MCALDKECRAIQQAFAGVVHRVEVDAKWWHFGFAYLPSSRYIERRRIRWTSFRRGYSPFDRSDPRNRLSGRDAPFLSGEPAALRVLTPVTIEEEEF